MASSSSERGNRGRRDTKADKTQDKMNDSNLLSPRGNLQEAKRFAGQTLYNQQSDEYMQAKSDGYFTTMFLKFFATRCICIPICLVLMFVPILFTLRFVDDAFPTIGAVPASARELGFGDMSFVHLYWPPSPPPSSS